MKSTLSLLIGFILCIQVYGQGVINRENRAYTYQEESLTRKDIKGVLANSEDSLTIKYLRNSKIGRATGSVLIGVGIFTTISLIGISSGPATCCTGGGLETIPAGHWIIGGILPIGLGIILINAGNKSFTKSINRFNSIQQSNLKMGMTRNGMGLIFYF